MSLNGITFEFNHQYTQGAILHSADFVAGSETASFSVMTAGISGDVLSISLGDYLSFSTGPDFHGMTIFDKNNAAPNIGGYTVITNPQYYDVSNITYDTETIFMDFEGMALTPTDNFSLRIELVPSDLLLSTSAVSENTSGAVVGALAVIDLNDADTHTLVVNDDRFEIAAGSLKLKDGIAVDFDVDKSIDVLVTATDSFGLEYEETFSIIVSDVVETFIGTKKDSRIEGTSGADILRGREGNDRLFGMDGDDDLRSIKGDDRLSGGAGADLFTFSTGSDRDIIMDFETGIDTIDISRWKAIDNFADLRRHAHNKSGDLWITAGNDTLILKDFAKGDLDGADFVL